jgi:disease resistance protein RPM1
MSDVAAASAAEGRGSRYILKPLSHANSEKLFYKRIFGGERNCPHIKLAEVSDKILKKCSGLPLAIITVASVLASKPWEEWSEVYNSITLRHESNRYVDNMRKVLSFSYYDLPFHLRSCLLHLSIFPENCLFIEKDFLIWKWVAEGFVQKERPGPRISLFEIGERYFNDLVNRSTIQIAEGCLNRGRVYGCRVHPVLFSQIRAISSEENFCTVFEDEHHTSPGNQHSSRRIAMHSIRNVEHNMEKVRSFNASLCFIDGSPQLSSFQVLRVLALEYCPGMNSHHLLKQIGNLVHLRYLGLVGAGVLELQEETLGWLKFLQTLDLRETEIEQLPRNIPDQLVCLCVHQIRTVVEGKIGRLTSLEDLRLRHVTGDIVKLATELSCLRKLRVLVLGFEKMDVGLEKALLESLGHLHKIQRLEIYCKPSTRAVMWEESCWVPSPNVHQLVLGGLLFSRLPSWMINRSPLPLLSHLQLGVEVLEDGDLEIFGRLLPQLRSLIVITTASASNEQQHPITLAHRGSDYVFGLFRVLNFFSTNKAVKFESRRGGPPMAKLEHVELRVRVAQCADSWLSSLANLKSLNKVTVVLNCRGASIAEQEEAEETLRRATGVHPIRRLKLEVTKENGNEEVLFYAKVLLYVFVLLLFNIGSVIPTGLYLLHLFVLHLSSLYSLPSHFNLVCLFECMLNRSGTAHRAIPLQKSTI